MANNFQLKRFSFPACRKFPVMPFLGLFIFGAGLISANFGDSLYGKVTAVKSATEMTFVYETGKDGLKQDSGKYEIQLLGIEVPNKVNRDATRFVSELILFKEVQMRFEGRTKEGIMLCRLYTADPKKEIREVALELVKAGLAQRQKNYDFKYGELSLAEREAQKAKLGLWQ